MLEWFSCREIESFAPCLKQGVPWEERLIGGACGWKIDGLAIDRGCYELVEETEGGFASCVDMGDWCGVKDLRDVIGDWMPD